MFHRSRGTPPISGLPPIQLEGLTFDSHFECGNGSGFRLAADGAIEFEIDPDTKAGDRQWFCVRIRGGRGRRLTLRITNIAETNIPSHWADACPVIGPTMDGPWGRVSGPCRVDNPTTPTSYQFQLTLPFAECLLAFHHPYSYTRHQVQMARWTRHPHVTAEVVGQSVEGRPIELLRVVNPSTGSARPLGVWLTCRQHAAETNASWFLDGFMEWLLSDAAARFRERVAVNVVPMINPDGVVAGNYRVNAAGVNLNRVWNCATAETSPEILGVTVAVRRWVETGNRYDFYIDLHGDSEALACYAFQPGPEIRPPTYPFPDRYHADSRRYIAMVAKRAEDFHPDEGIVNSEDINLSRQYMAFTYGVMSQLFENGYSYVNYGPNEGQWLTPERHSAIGRAAGEALEEYLLGG